MKLFHIFGRTTVWLDYDADGQAIYCIYPPYSPPTVDVNGYVAICSDVGEAFVEAKHIDAIFNRAFDECFESRLKCFKFDLRYRREYGNEKGGSND